MHMQIEGTKYKCENFKSVSYRAVKSQTRRGELK